jgi:hypothetical protein
VTFGIATGSFEEERDDWSLAIARAHREGWRIVELTAILPPLLDSLAPHLSEVDDFERVSVHAPVGIDSVAETIAAVLALPTESDVILHPDLYGAAPEIADLGPRAVFENMDVAKSTCRFVDELAPVFAGFPEAGFCLDVAHVWTNDTSLQLGHDLIDAFGDRLRQLHVSGIEPDGTHRPTTKADLELYEPLLDRCKEVPWLLEAVLV